MLTIKNFISGRLKNNSYLIFDKDKSNKAILIDPAQSYLEVKSFIDSENLFIDKILLTHGHFDHIMDVPIWQKLGAKVYGHPAEIDNLTSELTLMINKKYNQENVKIDFFISDNLTLNFEICEIKVLLTPGHTKGSLCYILDDLIFTGDTLFRESFGRTDFIDGDFSEIKKSIKKILTLKDNFSIYPGHDEFSTLDYERINNPIIKFLR